MELNIDTGVEEFRVNGRGVLRFKDRKSVV